MTAETATYPLTGVSLPTASSPPTYKFLLTPDTNRPIDRTRNTEGTVSTAFPIAADVWASALRTTIERQRKFQFILIENVARRINRSRDTGTTRHAVFPASAHEWMSAPRVVLERTEDILRRIDAATLDEREEGEPAPTKEALRGSKDLIGGSRLLARGFRFVSSVIPLDGAIRITWQSSTRNVRLVCPAYSEPYIYYERLIGRRSIEHGSEKATSESLSNRLRWLARSR